MGNALIWIESLAAALLLVAWVTACAARSSSGLVRRGVPALAGFVLIGLTAAFVYGLWLLTARGVVLPRTFAFFVAWAVALAVGVEDVLRRGWRGAAEAWPPGRLAVALAVVVILDCITISNMDLAVKVRMAALQAESGARILALAPPRPAERDNAAPVYQEAFEALTPLERLPSPWKEKSAVWFDPAARFDFDDKELAEFLRSQQRGLALLRKAAAVPACSFERDYLASADLLLPELQSMREGASVLFLDARSKARRGDARGALEDVAALLGMARHANEPILIALLVSAAIDRLGTSALEEVLARAAAKPEDLARLAVPDVSYRQALRRSLQMEEVAFGLPLLLTGTSALTGPRSKWLGEIVDPGGQWVLVSSFYRVFLLEDDLASYRRYMKSFQDLAARPYPEAREAWKRLDDDVRAHRGGGILSGLVLPAVNKVADRAAQADATHRLAQAALAAEAYRAKTGKLPARLDDLAPDYLPRVRADPFDGKPLRFKRDGKDLVLYSVGPDGTDDGGAPWDEARRRGDLVFRLRGR
jgi:hypothetical protein